MKVSLIVTSQGNRLDEIERFIKSLNNQTYKNYELIFVDQSDNNKVKNLLDKYDYVNKRTKLINTTRQSLSKARNMGMKEVTGEIIAFPDDDCWYDDFLLENIIKEFDNKKIDVLCTNVFDPEKREFYGRNRKVDFDEINIEVKNIFTYPISVGIFIMRKKSEDISFDENLGAGTNLGSGEETDMLLRLYFNKNKIIFTNKLYVYHPAPVYTDLQKTAKYAKGFGATIRKNLKINSFSLLIVFLDMLIKSFGGALIYLFKDIRISKGYFLRGMYSFIGFFYSIDKERDE